MFATSYYNDLYPTIQIPTLDKVRNQPEKSTFPPLTCTNGNNTNGTTNGTTPPKEATPTTPASVPSLVLQPGGYVPVYTLLPRSSSGAPVSMAPISLSLPILTATSGSTFPAVCVFVVFILKTMGFDPVT